MSFVTGAAWAPIVQQRARRARCEVLWMRRKTGREFSPSLFYVITRHQRLRFALSVSHIRVRQHGQRVSVHRQASSTGPRLVDLMAHVEAEVASLAPPPPSVPVVPARDLSPQQFLEQFMKPNLPVLITGLTDSWKARKEWVGDGHTDGLAEGTPNMAAMARAPLTCATGSLLLSSTHAQSMLNTCSTHAQGMRDDGNSRDDDGPGTRRARSAARTCWWWTAMRRWTRTWRGCR